MGFVIVIIIIIIQENIHASCSNFDVIKKEVVAQSWGVPRLRLFCAMTITGDDDDQLLSFRV